MLRGPQLRATFVALLLVGCANRGMEAPPLELDGSGGDSQAGGAGGIAVGTGGRAGQTGTGGAGTGGVATGGAAGGTLGKGGTGGAAGGPATGGVSGAGGSAGAAGQGATAGAGGASGGAAGGGGSAGGGSGGAAGAGGAGGTAIPMLAYYPFDQTSGPGITDASGNGHNGTAQGTVAFSAGQIGNALNLNNGTTGSNYVSLPANLLQGVNDLTITAWVWVRTDQEWARVFDFGSSTTKYMFLTPHAFGGGVRFAITTGGNGAGVEQQLTGPTPLPVGAWTHVAVVLQGTSNGTLYVNGTSVASSTSIPLRPSALGSMPNDWIGHSEFSGDSNFDGEIDDFRIYARALTAADIQAIYTQR